MSTSRVLASVGIISALALAGCVLDTTESDDPEEVMSADSPLGSAFATGDDGDDVDTLSDGDDVSRELGDPDTIVDPADMFGHEEEPDPVPWVPDMSGQESGGTSNDQG